MNELDLKAFISIEQNVVNGYKKMSEFNKYNYKSKYDYKSEIEQHKGIIDALEKQIAKPVQIKNVKSQDKKYGVCPNCKRGVVGEDSTYCKFCGQKLDWNICTTN